MGPQARIQFANWLKQEHPSLFQAAVTKASQTQMSALGAEEKSFWSKFTDAAMGLGTTYLALKNQRDAMKLNLERAKQGQPPIDPATAAPVVRTQVEVSPQLQRELLSTAGEGINKTLLLAGAAILGAFLIFGRRRRA